MQPLMYVLTPVYVSLHYSSHLKSLYDFRITTSILLLLSPQKAQECIYIVYYQDGQTPLHCAAAINAVNVAALLIKKGANINAVA